MQAGEVLWRGQQPLIVSSGSLRSATRSVPSASDQKYWVDALERFRAGVDRPVLLDRRSAQTSRLSVCRRALTAHTDRGHPATRLCSY